MKLTEKIEQQIQKIPLNNTFGYSNLGISKDEYQTAAKALERLQKKGIIKKLSKGLFYKPEMTVFGELKPNDQEILRNYLFKDGKRVAYITGASLYNQLGFTTQMAFRIKIASQDKRISINRGAIKAMPVKSYAEVTDENYELLGFLDAIKDIKEIQDMSIKKGIMMLISKIENLNDQQIQNMIDYALLYPPRVRALVGAILEQLNKQAGIEKLRDSLNPLSQIKLGINTDYLVFAEKWYIV
jgi:hypothetical protein